MGRVILATDRERDRLVALKIVHDLSGAAACERLIREADTLARVRHPRVVRLVDRGTSVGGPWLAMEYVEGEDLSRSPPADPVSTMLEVAEGLAAMHAVGLVHRDVKAQNIVASPDRGAVLVDLGLVRDPTRTPLTASGEAPGTPTHLAPEILRGGPASPASDWYAWGVCLYRMLEGTVPFPAPELAAYLGGAPFPGLRYVKVAADSGPGVLLALCLSDVPGERPAGPAAIREILASPSRTTRVSGVTPLRTRVAHRPSRAAGVPLLPGLALALASALLVVTVLGPAGSRPVGPEAPDGGGTGPEEPGPTAIERVRRFEAEARDLLLAIHGSEPEGESEPPHLEAVAERLADPGTGLKWARLMRSVSEHLGDLSQSRPGREALVRTLGGAGGHVLRDMRLLAACGTDPARRFEAGPAAREWSGAVGERFAEAQLATQDMLARARRRRVDPPSEVVVVLADLAAQVAWFALPGILDGLAEARELASSEDRARAWILFDIELSYHLRGDAELLLGPDWRGRSWERLVRFLEVHPHPGGGPRARRVERLRKALDALVLRDPEAAALASRLPSLWPVDGAVAHGGEGPDKG